MDKEKNRMMSVNDAGHDYELHNMGEGTQRLLFIKKEPVSEGSTEMHTVQEGTTNEAVLQMLIHRMKWLNERMPCRENSIVITKLEESLMWLEQRTAERNARGVEGTHQK